MTENIYPEMRMEDLFAVEALQPALSRDSTLNTHSLTNNVETPTQIANMFTSITYSKGTQCFSVSPF
jgi:aminopeptidase N